MTDYAGTPCLGGRDVPRQSRRLDGGIWRLGGVRECAKEEDVG